MSYSEILIFDPGFRGTEYGVFYTPSVPKPSTNQNMVHSEFFTHLGDASSNTTNGNNPVISSISCLLYQGGPFAVFSKITKVVIFSFKREALRAMAHVFQKIREVTPSFTHSYTAPTVQVIVLIFGIVTSLVHGQPYAHSRGRFVVYKMTMPDWSETFQFSLKAPTGSDSSGFKIPIPDALNNSAIALANAGGGSPSSYTGSVGSNLKSSKCVSYEGYFSGHGISKLAGNASLYANILERSGSLVNNF